ncbi:carbon-nitrogen hydrolase [Cunninghamella echinulata]|nr:carbon-nitrogen hydrolase [Cunninghamella echinulata]
MVRIAAVQLYTELNDINYNWKKIEEYLERAHQKQVELIVFPEYFLGDPKVMIEDPLPRLIELAKKYQIDIVTGSYEIKKDDKKYNCTNYIDKDGQVLLHYRKVHLWHPERPDYTPGDQFYTVQTRFGFTVGVCICWDIGFSDGFIEMVLNQGAQLICAPALWTIEDAGEMRLKHDLNCEAKFIDYTCSGRSFEFEVVMVYVNGAATPLSPPSSDKEKDDDEVKPGPLGTMVGHTQITVPFKGPLSKCDHYYEEMLIEDVDVINITKDAEQAYKVRDDWNKKKN